MYLHLVVLVLLLCFTQTQCQPLRSSGSCSDQEDENGEPAASQDDVDDRSLSFSEEFIKRAVIASELSYIAFEDEISTKRKVKRYNKIYDEFMAWYDGINDAHLLVKQDGVCYAVMRGTFQANFLDQYQNANPFSIRVPGTQCDARKGFFGAHFMTPYIKEFRRQVRKCVKSCAAVGGDRKKHKDDCPLIITGQSQGAAVSIAATLDRALNRYNPTTLAFGPLKTIVGSCPKKDLNTTRIYTFINASGGYYDDAPYGIPIGRHVGHVILVDEGNALSFVGINDNKDRSPNARKIHAVELYRTHMQSLADSGCFPIAIRQWENGHWCSFNDECLSRTCRQKVCQATNEEEETKQKTKKRKHKKLPLLTSGTACVKDISCRSGKCKLGRCTLQNGKLGLGARCKRNADCDTGRCTTKGNAPWEETICSPLRDLGMWCREDFDCLEENCSGKIYLPYLDRRCQPGR